MEKWLHGSVERIVMSVCESLELLPLSMVLLPVKHVSTPAPSSHTPPPPPPLIFILRCLVLQTVVKLIAVESTIKSNTNCHLCSSSTLRPHTPCSPALSESVLLLIGSPSCRSAFATPDWLDLPAPLSSLAH